MSLFKDAINPDGSYTRVKMPDIISALNSIALAAGGSDVDIDPRSVVGQGIGGIAEMLSDLEGHAADLRTLTNPNGATGAMLTNLAHLSGINRGAAGTGHVAEPDPNLRVRRQQATAIASTPMIDGLQAAIMALKNEDGSPAVLDAVVVENDTTAPITVGSGGDNTVNANSIRVLVHPVTGGSADPSTTSSSADPIANVIFNLKSNGCGTQGDIVKGPIDAVGNSHAIRYDLATPLAVLVRVAVIKRYNWPTDGEVQIKQAVATWAAGINATGKRNLPIIGNGPGLLSWTDVLASFLNVVPGFDFVSMEFSGDAGTTWTTSPNGLTVPFGSFVSIVPENVAVTARLA